MRNALTYHSLSVATEVAAANSASDPEWTYEVQHVGGQYYTVRVSDENGLLLGYL